jgi:hypothetical protein
VGCARNAMQPRSQASDLKKCSGGGTSDSPRTTGVTRSRHAGMQISTQNITINQEKREIEIDIPALLRELP